MYEFHGWFVLSESTVESDVGGLSARIEELRRYINSLPPAIMSITIEVLNGSHYLMITGNPNRRRDEGIIVGDLIELVRQRLPGSWGILYERDDKSTEFSDPNAFEVTVLARGNLRKHADPFLSPCNPTIED